jgi:hypothetical protein
MKLFPLSCSGVLCEYHLHYVHMTCCYCRLRRKALGKYRHPSYFIQYIYKASIKTFQTTRYIDDQIRIDGKLHGGKEYTSKQPFTVTQFYGCRIDPRGYFTKLRCATIIVLDNIMLLTHRMKPWVEVCELLANYP